jgi:hypothetical protein
VDVLFTSEALFAVLFVLLLQEVSANARKKAAMNTPSFRDRVIRFVMAVTPLLNRPSFGGRFSHKILF